MTTLVTPRLLLSPLRLADAPAVFGYRSDPEVARYQSWEPAAIEDVQRFIRELEDTLPGTPGTWYQLGIRLRDGGTLIGDVGLHFPAGRDAEAEIGVTVSPAYQGKGYAAEALRGALGYLFDDLGKHRVIASVDPRNTPSMRLMARLGMRQEALHRESLWFKGAWADDAVFAMLQPEWQAMRSHE
jgi:RimJ/RimL family protein N-acetyltransferase